MHQYDNLYTYTTNERKPLCGELKHLAKPFICMYTISVHVCVFFTDVQHIHGCTTRFNRLAGCETVVYTCEGFTRLLGSSNSYWIMEYSEYQREEYVEADKNVSHSERGHQTELAG